MTKIVYSSNRNLYSDWRFMTIHAIAWVFVAFLTMSESVFFYQINDREVPWVNILVNDSFFVLWWLISPGLVMMVRSFYFDFKKWSVFLIKLLMAAILVIALLLLLESSMRYYLLGIGNQKAYSDLLIQMITLRFHLNLILYLTVSGFAIAWFEYKKSRQLLVDRNKLNKQLIEAELDNLKKQIRPHFLFNSLHSIAALVLKNENQEAIKLIADLGELLRMSLKLNDRSWITINEEIEFTRKYLDIHSIRFDGQLKYDIQVADELGQEYIPSLIMQPVIENALVHGIVPNNNHGEIEIDISNEEDKINIEIANSVNTQEVIEKKREGVGLSNSKQRLKTLFEDDFNFQFGIEGQKFKTSISYPRKEANED